MKKLMPMYVAMVLCAVLLACTAYAISLVVAGRSDLAEQFVERAGSGLLTLVGIYAVLRVMGVIV